MCLPFLFSRSLYFGLQVDDLEKEIADSKQKIEFFHAKMQELVSTVYLFIKLGRFFPKMLFGIALMITRSLSQQLFDTVIVYFSSDFKSSRE